MLYMMCVVCLYKTLFSKIISLFIAHYKWMESTLIYILGVQLGSGVEIQFRLDAHLGKSGSQI